jgi:putative addiction module component (TIGR02574 family)
MSFEIPLETFTVAEKVRLLEQVWDSLCGEPGNIKSPDWHRDVLETRQKRLDEGLATVSPWSEAKTRLLQVGK